MYAKDKQTIIDRREMLKVKIMSLAAEARIIRSIERKTFGQIRDELHRHRALDVRREARAAHLAYSIIKADDLVKGIKRAEPNGNSEPDMGRILDLLKKYGPAQWRNVGQLKPEPRKSWVERMVELVK